MSLKTKSGLTPWYCGSKLPTIEMQELYTNKSEELYITSNFNKSKLEKRDKTINNLIQDFKIEIEEVPYKNGIIQARINMLDIINDFMKNIENEYNCLVKVRKDKGGKGIDFQIDFYQEFKNKVIKKKRYAFSLSPYWRFEEILEHRNNSENFVCQRLSIIDSSVVSDILNYNISRKSSVELNSNFKDEKWKVLLERKFPILKMN